MAKPDNMLWVLTRPSKMKCRHEGAHEDQPGWPTDAVARLRGKVLNMSICGKSFSGSV
jgi:hypothetical protein